MKFPDKPLIIVCGRICSGKGYLIQQNSLDHNVVSVSDIVRNIIKSDKRSDLQQTAHLNKVIGQELLETFEYSVRPLIVDGIRQLSILEYVLNSVSPDDVALVWVEVDKEVRKQRFLNRNSDKDSDVLFEQAEQADDQLGLHDLEMWMKQNNMTTIVNNG